MSRSMNEIVEEEIREFVRYGNATRVEGDTYEITEDNYYNNIDMNLPGGSNRARIRLWREDLSQEEDPSSEDVEIVERRERMFRDIDRVIEELEGLDTNYLYNLARSYRDRNWTESCRLIKPLYVRLRELGYTEHELTG